jgi:aminopeptidase
MRPANSTVDKNWPGNEVFEGPADGTIEGQYAIDYPVIFADRVLPNVVIVFKEGKAISWHTNGTADDKAHLDSIMKADEGVVRVGEIAFGGNPAINRPTLNPLYIEKMAGSVHLALGHALPDSLYPGSHIDNGVRSVHHIDITRLMTAQLGGGRVLFDGVEVQRDGFWLDHGLRLLNPRAK